MFEGDSHLGKCKPRGLTSCFGAVFTQFLSFIKEDLVYI